MSVFFILGMVLSSLVFIYFYGNTSPSMRRKAENVPSFRTFTVHFDPAIVIDATDLQVLDGYQPQDVYVSHQSDLWIPASQQFLTIQSYLHNNRGKELTFTSLFRTEDLDADAIILSTIHPEEEQIKLSNQWFNIYRKEGNLAGSVSFIPIKSYLRHQLPTSEIDYVLPSIPSKREVEEIIPQLQNIHSGGIVRQPSSLEENLLTDQLNTLFISGGLFLLSLFSYLYLFYFLLRENNREFLIFRTHGAKKKTVFRIIMLQTVFLVSLSFALALLMHRILYAPLFDPWMNVTRGMVYTLWDYLIVFGVVLLLTALLILPLALRFVSKGFRQQKK